MNFTTVGIDLAKNVFAVHGVDEHGKTVLKKSLKRGQVAHSSPIYPLPIDLYISHDITRA
jgi:hypothetical protein